MKQTVTFIDWPHGIIKRIAPLVSQKCPSMEKFWNTYVIPITDYQVNPFSPSWRNDTFPAIEGIGMSCFAVMKSLNFIDFHKDLISVADPDQRFKNIYFHFGLLFDIVDTLTRYILLTQNELAIFNFTEYITITEEEIKIDFDNWVKKYPIQLKKFKSEGIPIGFFPNRKRQLIEIIIKDEIQRNTYLSFVQGIKEYRNLFSHNPSVDVVRHQGEELVIKRKNLKISRYWSESKMSITKNCDQWINPQILVGIEFEKFLHLLENIWPNFIRETEAIFTHKEFNTLMFNYKRS